MNENRELANVPVDFITLFKDNLEKNNLTLVEVAEKTNLSQSYLSRLLARERGLPSDEVILHLSKALKIVPPESLLVAAGRVPVTKGTSDSKKIDQCLNKINELSDKTDEVREAAKSSAFIGKVLLGIAALVSVLLVLLVAWSVSKKKEEVKIE
ncbi:MAG TPA: helix-turn-helix transcriptional regulator [bacterium]